MLALQTTDYASDCERAHELPIPLNRHRDPRATKNVAIVMCHQNVMPTWDVVSGDRCTEHVQGVVRAESMVGMIAQCPVNELAKSYMLTTAMIVNQASHAVKVERFLSVYLLCWGTCCRG